VLSDQIVEPIDEILSYRLITTKSKRHCGFAISPVVNDAKNDRKKRTRSPRENPANDAIRG
jgi:hypothetical protein